MNSYYVAKLRPTTKQECGVESASYVLLVERRAISNNETAPYASTPPE